MFRLMVDTETLSIERNARVFQIGAVVVTGFGVDARFTYTVNPIKLIMDYGATGSGINSNTVQWHITKNSVNWFEACSMPWNNSVREMGEMFGNFVSRFIKAAELADQDYEIWCRGTDFDIPILQNLFESLGVTPPWKYNKVRDLRTVIAMYGEPDVAKPELGHNALVDASYQTEQLQQILLKTRN